jgi:superfamily II DNA/RNA helicase
MSVTNQLVSTMEDLKVFETFDAMGLKETVARGINSYGFDTPSKIQRIAIKPMIDGCDIIAQSQSGTGKTGTFTIGSIQHIDPTNPNVQVLVLSPTRELAQQTEKVARGIGQYMETSATTKGLRCASFCGGTPVHVDQKALRQGAQFVAGTPGRIYDLITRKDGPMRLDHLKYLILDEADQLLEELFAEQIRAILATGKFLESTHLAMFSATMPEEVLDLAARFLKKDHVKILVPAEEVRLKGINQYYVDCERDDWKFDVLADLYKHMSVNQAIIFANKIPTVEKLTKRMLDAGYTLECIHGDMETSERKKRLQDFRDGTSRILIATDVLARGVDVQQVSLVINYEMPNSRENYFHRIGRSGRYGRKGVSINLIGSADEMELQKDIEKSYSLTIPSLPGDLAGVDM